MPQIRFDVPMIEQGSTSLCWLACATMIISYKYRNQMAGVHIQHDIGSRIRDLPTDRFSAEFSIRTLSRLGFSTRKTNILSPIGRSANRNQTTSRTWVQQGELYLYEVLNDHGPFILLHDLGAFSYGPDWPGEYRGVGHAVVIVGINTARHTGYFNNPWGNPTRAGETGNEPDYVATSSRSILGAIRRWEARGNRSLCLLN